MLKPYRDLLILIVLGAILIWAINLFGIENVWLRTVLALPFLLGTGYLVGAAIFPGNQLEVMERFLLSLGLSLSILVLTGLLLHFTPSGLTAEAWAGILFLVSAIAAAIAYMRRSLPRTRSRMKYFSRSQGRVDYHAEGDTLAGAAYNQEREYLHPVTESNSRLGNMLMIAALGLSLLIVGLSAGMTFLPAPQKPFQGYSMLWMVPLQPSGTTQVELGLRSMEFNPQTYRIDLYLGDQLVQQWEDIQLQPQQQWMRRLNMNEFGPGDQQLEARLYIGNQTQQPYRLARLSLPTALNDPAAGN